MSSDSLAAPVALLVGAVLGGALVYGAGAAGVLFAPADGPAAPGLENASVWVGGTVERVGDGVLYVDDSRYGDVVVPITLTGDSRSFRCRPGGECAPVDPAAVGPGVDVCAFAHVRDG
ncbi:MAG: hypothetical protein ABEJ44_01855, partial [Halanaeroarchaeum sp.]